MVSMRAGIGIRAALGLERRRGVGNEAKARAGELEPDYAHPATPESVRAVVTRATDKDPVARYPDMASLTAAFKAAVEGGWVRPTPPTSIARNPYKGLRPFDEADASDFFGRQQLTAQLVSHLSETGNAARFIAVVGPSGCGKSSAVRAGLVPAIRCGGVPGSERWFVVEMQPGVQPFDERGDPRFAQYVNRRTNWGQLIDELESWSQQRTTQEVQAVFDRHGVPSSPYRTVKDAMDDPQLAHRRAFAEVCDAGGTFLALNPPFRMSAARPAAAPHVAELGEHTEELLAAIGYTPAQVTALISPAAATARA